jgi:hypothetical protein
MLALFLLLVIVAIVLGMVGLVAEALLYLLITGIVVLLLITGVVVLLGGLSSAPCVCGAGPETSGPVIPRQTED